MSLQRYTPLRRSPLPPRSSFITRVPSVPREPSQRARRAVRDTGFPPAVKLGTRERARFRCECHGFYLGEAGGEIQHRVARGMGGRGAGAEPWFRTMVNAALMCRPGHAEAESRSAEMHEAGFWLYSWENPAEVPILLHGSDGGTLAYLTPEGGYSRRPVGGVIWS